MSRHFTRSGTATLGLLSIALGLLALLAGCASQPRGVLSPVAERAADASKVDLLVATTRAPSADPGVYFSGERGPSLSLANIVVSIPPNRQPGTIEWPRAAPGNPETSFVTTAVDPIARKNLPHWFKDHAVRGRRVLIFVHGFNTQFDASVFRFAQIVHDSHADVAPVLFSWPSRGRLFDYNYDRESTNFSRSDLAEVIQTAVRSPDVSEITIMAHSMGAWPTVEALRQIALVDGRISPKVTDVILASPDLDLDVFGKQLADIGPKRPHFTIFVSTNDRALRLSRFISGSVTRVGAVDLSVETYKAKLDAASGITVLDLSALQNGDRLNHSQFATSPEVVQLLGERLIDGQVIDSDSTGSDQLSATAVGTGQAIGQVAGAALTAPIRVFTAPTRN